MGRCWLRIKCWMEVTKARKATRWRATRKIEDRRKSSMNDLLSIRCSSAKRGFAFSWGPQTMALKNADLSLGAMKLKIHSGLQILRNKCSWILKITFSFLDAFSYL